ncbi:MAG: hypothetical protein PHR16_12730 [Methylovulum sp.]|nr:hypothetical protein [Methylovulum sp.]
MKLLFFLIVLANVTLFMWEYKTGALTPVITTPPANATPDLEPLLLVSELPPASVQPEAKPPETLPQPVTDNTAEKVIRCYEAGPFTKKADTQRWVSQLADAETTVKLVSKDEQIPSKYKVYYPAGKPEATLQMLKGQDINDFFVERAEKGQSTISLGVFSKEERALMLKKQLLTKGIEAKIKTLYKTKIQQYALIESGTTGLLETLQKTMPQIFVKELLPCH